MGRQSGVISAEMRFVYQVVISCMKLNLDAPTSIKILNNLIKQNKVDYENVDQHKFDHLKFMVSKYLTKYKELKVNKSNYTNPRLKALIYQLQVQTEDTPIINTTTFQTDSLVKQELNKIFDNDKKYENKTNTTTTST